MKLWRGKQLWKKGGAQQGAQCLLFKLKRASGAEPAVFTLGPQPPVLPALQRMGGQ